MKTSVLAKLLVATTSLYACAAVAQHHAMQESAPAQGYYPAVPQYQQPGYAPSQYQQPRPYNPYAQPYAPAPQGQMSPYGYQYPPSYPNYSAPAPATENRSTAEQVVAGDTVVTIQQMRFNQPQIVIKKGSTVTWQQADRMRHDVVADDGSFESPRMRRGESFSHTFDKPGVYNYYCSLHPRMRGQVKVVE